MRTAGRPVRRVRIQSVLVGVMTIAAVIAFSSFAEADSAQTASVDAAKKRIARIKRFLQRAIDDLDQTQFFAREDIGELQKQIDALSFTRQSRTEDELRSFTDWHYDYENMLDKEHAAFERNLNAYYSGSSEPQGWTSRYDAMRERHLQLKAELAGRVKRLEDDKRRTEDNLLLLQNKLLRLLEPVKDDERRLLKDGKKETKKRDPHEEELLILQLETEIRALERLIPQYTALIEKARGALDWLSLKTEDYEALATVAKMVVGADPAEIESAYKGVMRTYESDIAFLSRRIEDFDRKRSSLTRSGTSSALDRQEELSAYFERRKSRYERQVNWLKTQLGNYRAELVDIWNDADVKRAQ